MCFLVFSLVFFFPHTATPEIYTLSYTTLFRSAGPTAKTRRALRALSSLSEWSCVAGIRPGGDLGVEGDRDHLLRSEEHTSELQSHSDLVCRLLLEKKNNTLLGTRTMSRNVDRD